MKENKENPVHKKYDMEEMMIDLFIYDNTIIVVWIASARMLFAITSLYNQRPVLICNMKLGYWVHLIKLLSFTIFH